MFIKKKKKISQIFLAPSLQLIAAQEFVMTLHLADWDMLSQTVIQNSILSVLCVLGTNDKLLCIQLLDPGLVLPLNADSQGPIP